MKNFGEHIYGQTIGEMWIQLVKAVLSGEESEDEGRKRLALQAVRVKSETQIIEDKIIKKYGNGKFISSLVGLTFEDNKMYDFDVVQSFGPGADSYYKRIQDGRMIDFIIKRLAKFPESKKAIMVFPNKNDYKSVLENPTDDYFPCIVSIQFRLVPNNYDTMNTIFYARSIDAFQKSNGNFIAIAMLSHEIAKRLSKNLGREIKVGTLDGLICDAHVYNECYDDAKKLIKEYETTK